ncbi:MAG: hypothetical protein AAF211_15825 [Myxococcota bacterium]
MDREGIALMGLAGTWMMATLVLFGVVVVRRRDPPAHGFMVGSYLFGAGMFASWLVLQRLPWEGWRAFVGLTLMFASLLLITGSQAWALAAAIRPGEPVTPSASRAWLHGVIVAVGIMTTGLLADDGPAVFWWLPNLVHIPFAFRDGPRLRRAWGDVASIALVVTLGWFVGGLLNDVHRFDIAAVVLALVGHHLVAIAHTRTGRPSLLVWPLLGLLAFQLTPR